MAPNAQILMTAFSIKTCYNDYLPLVGYSELLSILELSRYLGYQDAVHQQGYSLRYCCQFQTTYYTITTGNQDVGRRPTQ